MMQTNNILTQEEEQLLQSVIDEQIFTDKRMIPQNTESILVDSISSRFSSADWYNNVKSKEVFLAGLGGIGSYVAFLLSRLQIKKLTMWDADKVEDHNLSGQLYSLDDINLYKVLASFNMLQRYSNFHNISYFESFYTEGSHECDIMICGFDNMEARKIYYNNWKKRLEYRNNKRCLFIDGRLAAEEFQIFCLTGDDKYNQERYEKEFLFSDAEADATICSYKQTSFCANMIASYIINLFVNFCANECNPLIERDLPFITQYNCSTMYLKTIA